MDKKHLEAILQAVRQGEMEVTEAMEVLKNLPFQDLGFARVDHHRALRLGFPEVIYCAGKTPEQVAAIFRVLAEQGERSILATRAKEEAYQAVLKVCPQAVYHDTARIIAMERGPRPRRGHILVVSAGTSDLPVAEEAAITAEVMGNRVSRLYDAGVAGLHRLLAGQDLLNKARVVIVVAGMDGALPSVVGGLVAKPVIAVPTSVGYGASFHGLAALLTMLNSCAPGVLTVNIDNGFGAAYAASLINQGQGD